MSDDSTSPEPRRRAARAVLAFTPFGAVFVGLLAALQGAPSWEVVLLAVVMVLFSLAAAGLVRLRGSKATGDTQWIAALLRLLVGR